MGNRIAKHIYTDNTFTLLEKSTYYVRDASGNVMAVYDRIIDASIETGEFMLSERHIYGSSRIGMDVSTHVFGPDHYTSLTETTRELGHKQYEISNHLGNVLSVITDQKLPVEVGSLIVSYSAVVVTATDYSPFGVGLYGRSWSGEYRYGFNGQEKDGEIVSEGTHTSAQFWMYDTRLGRRWELDPVFNHSASNCSVLNCNPINYIDPKGDEPTPKKVERKVKQLERKVDRAMKRNSNLTRVQALDNIVRPSLSLKEQYVEHKTFDEAQGSGYKYYDIVQEYQARNPLVNAPAVAPMVGTAVLTGTPTAVFGPTFDDQIYNFIPAGPNANPVGITVTNNRPADSVTDLTNLSINAITRGNPAPIPVASGIDVRPGTNQTFAIPVNAVSVQVSYTTRNSVTAPTLVNNIVVTLNFTVPNPARTRTPTAERVFSASRIPLGQLPEVFQQRTNN